MRRAICVLLVLSWLPREELAGQTCDPALKVRPNDPLGYRVRGDRCEGMFVEEVSGTISVASVHFPRRNFQPQPGTPVHFAWSLPPSSEVRIQAASLLPKVFFRMDAVRPAGSTTYDWPTDFVNTVKLRLADIGLLSWANVEIGGEAQRVYSPVSVQDRSGEVEVVLVPEAQLEEVYYSVVKIDGRGRSEGTVVADRPLKLGFYPAGQPLTIQLPALEAKRVYRLEVAARLKSGGAINRDVYVVNY